MAKTLSNISLKNTLISSLHFKAIEGQSAVDITSTLTYNVEKAFENKEVVTVLAFDIKKTFHRISKIPWVQRLLNSKLPLSLICWVSFFLKDKKATIRLDRYKRAQESIDISCLLRDPSCLNHFYVIAIIHVLSFFKKRMEKQSLKYSDMLITDCL